MQKPQKYIVVICCAVLLVCALSLLTKGAVGGVEGKFFGNFTVPDTLTIQAKTLSYTVTYINEGKTLHSFTVALGQGVTQADLQVQHDIAENNLNEQIKDNPDYAGYQFEYWMNAGSSEVLFISADNEEDIVLYPSFVGVYTIMFLDNKANVLYYELFAADAGDTATLSPLGQEEVKKALTTLKTDAGEDFTVVWDETTGFTYSNFSIEGGANVTVKPVYSYSGTLTLTPIDTDNDGDTDYYRVDGYGSETNLDLRIPSDVNGIPVTELNTGAFAGFDAVYSVKIPDTITSIGSNAMADGDYNALGGRETITLYFDGDPNKWKQYMDLFYANKEYSYYTDYNTVGSYASDATTILTNGWDDGMGDGSRIFFLGEDGKVDTTAGYWELCNIGYKKNGDGLFDYGYVYVWIFHNHAYSQGAEHSGCSQPVSSDQATNYLTDTMPDSTDYRPDRDYWTTETES